MKGRTVQMLATDACNRLLDSASLKNQPPVGYDASNMAFAQTGGPEIYPCAQWPTIDPVKVYSEIGGDPSALASVMMQSIQLYNELTGVLPARVGAQTRSHTTAYAKGAEIERGATRTVDYVNATGVGPITRWLDMAYTLGRDAIGRNEDISFYIEAYGGFVSVDKSQLAENVSWEWFGSGGPADRQQKAQNKLNALQLALKMDQLAMSVGKRPTVDIAAAIRETLREGGWQDLEAITDAGSQSSGGGAPGGVAPAPGIPGASQGNPGAAVAALQNLSGAGG